MEIKIIGSSEIVELEIKDSNGIEWTEDLVDASGFWDEENEQFEMTQEDFEFWVGYIENYKKDEEEIERIASGIGVDAEDIREKINSYLKYTELENEHKLKKLILSEIKRNGKV